jgi:hypothetical protein
MAPWIPSLKYNFKADITHGKRPFLHEWLKHYVWLCYSSVLKGALCKYCVLFESPIKRGSFKGVFIKNVFCNYKKFHEQAKVHLNSDWHKFTTLKSKDFISVMLNKTTNVHQMIDNSVKLMTETNTLKLKSIVSSIFFLGTHGLPLRGHSDDSALFNDLLKFRVECGDNILEDHFKNAPKNATYLSHRIQNEFINIFGSITSNKILEQIKKFECYCIRADETMDICRTEQMSICIRYTFIENQSPIMREDFLGFIST